jgi:hypothetical protein
MQRMSRPILPYITSVNAPENVEHPVGRRRQAHGTARGGAEAGGRQRRPGVSRRAEAVHVVVQAACMYVCVYVHLCIYVYLYR